MKWKLGTFSNQISSVINMPTYFDLGFGDVRGLAFGMFSSFPFLYPEDPTCRHFSQGFEGQPRCAFAHWSGRLASGQHLDWPLDRQRVCAGAGHA